MKEKIMRYAYVLAVVFLSIVVHSVNAQPKMLLIGAAGKQAQLYFTLLQERTEVEFVGFVVREVTQAISQRAAFYNIKLFDNLDTALQEVDFDIALIVLPHHLHHEVTVQLLAHNKSIIKEKPLACTSNEIESYRQSTKIPVLLTIVQRNFQEPFFKAKEDVRLIGVPYSFCYTYHMNLKDITSGWRSKYEYAKGGVLLDMGYHVIDIINNFFGIPTTIQSQFSYCYDQMRKEELEDRVQVLFDYGSKQLSGSIDISRHYHCRQEEFVIVGSQGSMIITPQGYTIFNRDGSIKKEYLTTLSKDDERLAMLTCYLQNIGNQTFIDNHFRHHERNVALIEKIYKSSIQKIIGACSSEKF